MPPQQVLSLHKPWCPGCPPPTAACPPDFPPSRRRAARDADPLLPNQGITEDSIPSVLLPQARSARQAIQVRGAGCLPRRGCACLPGCAARWSAGEPPP